MKKSKSPDSFIKKPKIIGGKSALLKIVKENLQYPEKAINNKIEGDVHISFEVTGNGKIVRPKITQGIGYGCNEEAIRLIKMLKYEKVKNRKLNIHLHQTAVIKFKLPKKAKEKKSETRSPEVKYHLKLNEKPKGIKTYTYKINV